MSDQPVPQVLCPVYDHELKLITLITINQQTLDEVEDGCMLTVEVAPDPKAFQVANPDPKDSQIELSISKITAGGHTTATFFAADPEKAMRLPTGFASGQSMAVAETYNRGFKAGVGHRNRSDRRGGLR